MIANGVPICPTRSHGKRSREFVGAVDSAADDERGLARPDARVGKHLEYCRQRLAIVETWERQFVSVVRAEMSHAIPRVFNQDRVGQPALARLSLEHERGTARIRQDGDQRHVRSGLRVPATPCRLRRIG